MLYKVDTHKNPTGLGTTKIESMLLGLKRPLSEVNVSESTFYDDGYNATYHVNLIYLLDRLFESGHFNSTDDYKELSIEQERFFKLFTKQAHGVTTFINEGDKDIYKNMDLIFQQLDHFLGGYLGENKDEYAR